MALLCYPDYQIFAIYNICKIKVDSPNNPHELITGKTVFYTYY